MPAVTHAVTGLAVAMIGSAALVTEHAVDQEQAARHRAVCGAALPVVDRTRPWTGPHEGCCPACAALLPVAAA